MKPVIWSRIVAGLIAVAQLTMHSGLIPDGRPMQAVNLLCGVLGIVAGLLPSMLGDGNGGGGLPLPKASALLPWLGLGVLFTFSACAGTVYDRARQTLTAIETARAGAEKALATYDGPHQLDIVAQAKSNCALQHPVAGPEQSACIQQAGQRELAAWRNDFEIARKAFVSLDAAVSSASVAINVAEIAKGPGKSVDSIVQALLPGLRAVADDLGKLGVMPAGINTLLGSL